MTVELKNILIKMLNFLGKLKGAVPIYCILAFLLAMKLKPKRVAPGQQPTVNAVFIFAQIKFNH